MAFDKKTWANNQAGGTPLDASGLNDLEDRIEQAVQGYTEVKGSDYIYRKWDNGLLEIWGEFDAGARSATSSWGSIYYGDHNATLTFPTIFSEPPRVFTNLKSNTFISLHIRGVSNTAITSFTIFNPVSTSYSLKFDYYAVGRWE